MQDSLEDRDNTQPLFRSQVVTEAANRFGSPVKPIGPGSWSIAIFMAILLVCIAVFLGSGSYTRKETAFGTLVPPEGAARIIGPRDGVISQLLVADGDVVKVGSPILAVSSDISIGEENATISYSEVIGSSFDREYDALLEKEKSFELAFESEQAEIDSRRSNLQEDQINLSTNIQLQEERVRISNDTLRAGESLHQRQLFSTLALRQREEAVLAARQSLLSLRREAQNNRASISQLVLQERQSEARLAQSRADIKQTFEQLAQRNAQRQAERSLVLTSSRDGRVAALQARVGAPVRAGRTLAVILPIDESLQAELWLPSRAAGFVRPGDEVRLMYDAFPYQKFGVGKGTVTSVARAPTDPGDLPISIEAPESLYRVVIDLHGGTVTGYGRTWQLSPGMRVSADLVLDRRSLLEWLFDPIVAARQRGG